MRAIGIEVQTQALPPDALFAPDGPLFQRQFDLVLLA